MAGLKGVLCQWWMASAGLLAGIQARVQRPEYARLLSDCQILYCDTRLQLVSGITQDAILHMSSQPLPVLARDGWAYLMQVCSYLSQGTFHINSMTSLLLLLLLLLPAS